MQSSKPIIAPSFKSGIPVPEKRSSGKYDWLKAWAVNDCIDVNSRKEANNIVARAYLQKPWGHEGKIVTRTVNTTNGKFVRLWRVQ